MNAVLQLIVQRGETEGDLFVAVGQLHASSAGHVVVEGFVQARTLYVAVDEEVGDLQLQQRSARSHQLLQIYQVVAVECTKQQVTIAHRDGSAL